MPYWHVELLDQIRTDYLIQNEKQEKSANSKDKRKENCEINQR
jgi:hypothetical protein